MDEQKLKHSPLPWHLYTSYETGNNIAVSFNYSEYGRASVCQMPMPHKYLTQVQINANAEYIKLACNILPELIEALEFLVRRENEHGQFRMFHGEIVLTADEVFFAQEIIKRAKGGVK